MIKGIHGFNIAVENLEEATARYEAVFGVKAQPLGLDDFAFPGLTGARLDVGGLAVQLLASTDENSSVAKFLNSRGEGLFLVSVEVDDMDGDVADLQEKGLNFVLPEPIRGDFGAVDFSHPKSMHGVQFEFIQLKRD